jgi:hypothetical protein
MSQSAPPFMLYATPAGRPLYERLGFGEVDGVRKLIGAPRPSSAGVGVRVASSEDEAAIVARDTEAFGVDRSRLMNTLLSRAQRVVVDESGGFAIRWFNGDLAVVGPVVAENQEAAITLVDAVLLGCSSRARIDVALRSMRLVGHLRALGLDDRGDAQLMTYPAGYLPGDRARYHAIALQGFG